MVASRRVGAALQRHPLTWSIVLTIIWLVAVHGLAEVLTPGRRGTEGDLRAAAVNAGALVVPLAVIAVAGWRLRAGLGAGRRRLLLVPIAVLYASYLAFGVRSLPASAVLAAAVLQLALGVNEEVMFRGLIQAIWDRQSAVVQCTAVALLFGLQHSANVLWGQPLLDTAEQVLSATVTGFAFAAVRLHVGSIWGLAVVHALGNFCNDISAGVPLWGYVMVDALIFAYGVILLRRAVASSATPTSPGRVGAGG